ncbi:MAG: hypothetical protein KDD67_09550 [Ignavibacteriae bacterium]|nr:hypothetical protein [Ignavibacteriota bacterium]
MKTGYSVCWSPISRSIPAFLLLLLWLTGLLVPELVSAQNRDFNAERIIIDDNADDGTRNTMTIQTPDSLGQDVILRIPDMGTDSAQFILVPFGSAGPWFLNGNAGTTAGANFLGTTDATALHLYVNGGSGGASNSLILNTNRSIQRDTGGNARGNNAVDLQIVRDDPAKVASGVSAFIGGGERNRAASNRATVSGGFGNNAAAVDATIAGGTLNTASSLASTVSGGQRNTASGFISNIAGGARNTTDGQYGAIIGGRGLTLNGEGSFGYLGNNFTGSLNGNNRMTVDSANVGVFGNTDLWLANNDGEASRLLLFEPNSTVGAFPRDTTYHTSFEAGDQSADINYTLPTAQGGANTVLTNDGSGALSWTTVSGGGGGLTHFTESYDSTNNIAGLQPSGSATHISIMLGPKGNGALQADVTDSAASGGVARGNNAVDLQMNRNDSSRVASGSFSTISGGQSNGASGQNATVGGGLGNVVAGNGATVAGGQGNSAEVSLATIGGGFQNRATGFRSTVAGGRDNWVDAQNATIGGGTSNYVSGSRGVVAGGDTNVVLGSRSTISGGFMNKIEGVECAIPGGAGLTLDATANNTFGFHSGSTARPMTISASDVAVFGNADLWLANNDNAVSQLRFYERYNTTGAFPNTANFTSFESPATLAANIEYILPAAAGAVGQQLTVSGVAGTRVTLGWAAASDVMKKTEFLTLSGEDVLKQFRTFDLGTWRYDPIIDPQGKRHYGVMAQDFNRAFGNDGVGEIGSDTTVDNLDLHGVAWLAIQGLEERTSQNRETSEAQVTQIEEQTMLIEELRAELQSQRTEIEQLRQMLEQLKESLPD